MNYLSFDVGIKNLAYCELDPEKNILQWGTINLDENPICDVSLNKLLILSRMIVRRNIVVQHTQKNLKRRKN